MNQARTPASRARRNGVRGEPAVPLAPREALTVPEASGRSGASSTASNTASDVSSDAYDSDDDFSRDESEDDVDALFVAAQRSQLSKVVNKALLLLPLLLSLVFRSIASSGFRTVAIAWGVILSLTSDISMDEGVVPALVAASLGSTNGVVMRNMYISIARSRLGLFALAVLSAYSANWQILVCGGLLKLLVTGSSRVLQGSIPLSETTLISGALVNALFTTNISQRGDVYNPSALIACGLVAAVPCYPLLARYTRVFRQSHGTTPQTRLVAAVYVLYFTVAAVLYFWVYGVRLASVGGAVAANTRLIGYWVGCLSVALGVATLWAPRLGLDGRRKLWHLTTVTMFLPPGVRHAPFTKFALAVAVVLFVALEVARATALPPLGVPLHRLLADFVDHRDRQGPAVISHIYLLLGIATPVFLGESPAGVICLGLGDTFASQIGRRFGRWRIFGHKSVEGCVAFAAAAGTALYLFDRPEGVTFLTVAAVVVPTAVLEAVTPLNDNLIVPMYLLALQGLLRPASPLAAVVASQEVPV